MRNFKKLIRHKNNNNLFKAVEMAIMSLQTGKVLNIHAYGVRGTGKTTIMRAARSIMPPIRRIKGCLYNCDPANPLCPEHRSLGRNEIASIGVEVVPMPFLEISHSAKLGTVVGSIDLQRLIDHKGSEAALLPGTLAQANRGVVFVDEINRLADTAPELADVLLDLMGTKPGRLQIEEPGLSKVELPITTSVWAASNPDEDPGPLDNIRRQLSDRFDLSVEVRRPESIAELVSIMLVGDDCAVFDGFRHSPLEIDAEVWNQLVVPDSVLKELARLFLEYEIESMRSLKSWYLACRFHALWCKKAIVDWEDVALTCKLCLDHRVELEVLEQIMAELAQKIEPQVQEQMEQIEQESPVSHLVPNIDNTAEAEQMQSSSQGLLWKLLHGRYSNNKEREASSRDRSYQSEWVRQHPIGNKQNRSSIADPLDTKVKASPCPAKRLRDIAPGTRVRGEEGRRY